VPGNETYVITVGAVNSNLTPGDWSDDVIPAWSASGPTLDSFVKPDVLAPGSNIVSFMYYDPRNLTGAASSESPEFIAAVYGNKGRRNRPPSHPGARAPRGLALLKRDADANGQAVRLGLAQAE
jgi:hypothetical protein